MSLIALRTFCHMYIERPSHLFLLSRKASLVRLELRKTVLFGGLGCYPSCWVSRRSASSESRMFDLVGRHLRGRSRMPKTKYKIKLRLQKQQARQS